MLLSSDFLNHFWRALKAQFGLPLDGELLEEGTLLPHASRTVSD